MSWRLGTWSIRQEEKQKDKLFSIALWFVMRILLLISTLAMSGFAHPFYVATIWTGVHDDSAWFLTIAQTGYWAQTTPFFPLYPLLIKGFHFIFLVGFTESGLIISNAFLILDVYLFVRLGRSLFNKKIGYLAALIFAFFPTNFFSAGLYSESIFIFGILLCLYAIQNKQFPLACLAAGIAALTRNEGIFLVIPLAFCAWGMVKEGRSKWVWAWIAVPCLFLSFYFAFLWIRFGNPLIFSDMESLWGRVHTFPLWTLIKGTGSSIHTFIVGNWYEKAYYSLNFGAVVLALFSLVYTWRNFPKAWAILVLAMILLPLCAPGIGMETIVYQPRKIEDYFFSFDRFVIPMVPLFFALAKRISELNIQRFVIPGLMVAITLVSTPITQHIFLG